jgi:hypothetical protein
VQLTDSNTAFSDQAKGPHRPYSLEDVANASQQSCNRDAPQHFAPQIHARPPSHHLGQAGAVLVCVLLKGRHQLSPAYPSVHTSYTASRQNPAANHAIYRCLSHVQ